MGSKNSGHGLKPVPGISLFFDPGYGDAGQLPEQFESSFHP